MKKQINQNLKFDKKDIELNLMQRVYELTSLAVKIGHDDPLFMEITKIQCELIKLKKSI